MKIKQNHTTPINQWSARWDSIMRSSLFRKGWLLFVTEYLQGIPSFRTFTGANNKTNRDAYFCACLHGDRENIQTIIGLCTEASKFQIQLIQLMGK